MELEDLVLELILLLGVRSKHIMALDILEKYLVSRLKFIMQIAEFMPGFCSEEDEEILDVLKQLADYDISAKTVRKIERNTTKNGFDIVYKYQLMTQFCQ